MHAAAVGLAAIFPRPQSRHCTSAVVWFEPWYLPGAQAAQGRDVFVKANPAAQKLQPQATAGVAS